jgi:hypothetical protein
LVHFLARVEIFLLFTASRLALGFTQSPIQWVLALPDDKVVRGMKLNYLLPPSAKFNNGGVISPMPNVLIVWCLIKLRDNFIYPVILS